MTALGIALDGALRNGLTGALGSFLAGALTASRLRAEALAALVVLRFKRPSIVNPHISTRPRGVSWIAVAAEGVTARWRPRTRFDHPDDVGDRV